MFGREEITGLKIRIELIEQEMKRRVSDQNLRIMYATEKIDDQEERIQELNNYY